MFAVYQPMEIYHFASLEAAGAQEPGCLKPVMCGVEQIHTRSTRERDAMFAVYEAHYICCQEPPEEVDCVVGRSAEDPR